MKTRGLVVVSGYVAAETAEAGASWRGVVPVQFWNRLKHAISRASLVDVFREDQGNVEQWPASLTATEREQRLFERWVRRLGYHAPRGHYDGEELWPWTRGWTEDQVDAYLTEAP